MKLSRQRWTGILSIAGVFLLLASFMPLVVRAADDEHPFSLQVTPSPIVTTVTPGQATTIDLKIRNGSTDTENLKIEARSFRVDNNTGEVNLENKAPAEVKDWISFKERNFTVNPGEWYTQKVTFDLPKETGFSYSLALVISRQKEPQSIKSGRLIRGSVAVFTLLNVDRPGATRQLNVSKFIVTKRVYEFLPASFEIRFHNSGNSIVQPYGNLFIQRGSNSDQPITTLPVNEKRGYILPGSVRTLNVQWTDGFPKFVSVAQPDGSTKTKLKWNWSNASNFRIGRYTANLVAVYNDGTRDIPIRGEVSFWVIPWRIIIVGLIFVLILVFGVWSMIRKSIHVAKSVKSRAKQEK